MSDKTLDPCFVICPIGKDSSPERRRSDDILRHLIEPVAKEHGYQAFRASDAGRPGDITVQIVAAINDASLVVVDLTGHNPNVFYELAIAHAFNKPFILLRGDDLPVPFDVSVQNVIPIDLTGFGGAENTKRILSEHFKAVREGSANLDNPFTRFTDKRRIDSTGTPIEKQVEALKEIVVYQQRDIDHLKIQENKRNAIGAVFPQLTSPNTGLAGPNIGLAGGGLLGLKSDNNSSLAKVLAGIQQSPQQNESDTTGNSE
ncbi:MAG: hypothetical protein HQL43_16365 [Alphaproteobacteria bacterium]|nr:hypothetical protein [Alphaproteobacteria bacterium]